MTSEQTKGLEKAENRLFSFLENLSDWDVIDAFEAAEPQSHERFLLSAEIQYRGLGALVDQG